MTLVLDSSAVLAALRREPGAAVVEATWDESVIGATNHAEVVTKLVERGLKPAQVDALLDISPPLPIIPFDKAQATTAGLLRADTRHLGLSLGDRACLALALAIGAEAVLTTDRDWAKLALGVEVRLIR